MKRFLEYFAIISLFVLAACTNEEFGGEGYDGGEKSCRLSLNASVSSYDGTRAGSAHEWEDGDALYITFKGDYDQYWNYIKGVAKYSADSREWTLSYYGTINSGNGKECEVTFFDGAVHSDSIVSLNQHMAAYKSTSASYHCTADGAIILTARLAPESGRIRFVSDNSCSFTLKGLSYNVSYASDGSVVTSAAPLSLSTVWGSEMCATDYIYASFADGSCALEVVNGDYIYTKEFPSEMLDTPNSGLIKLPTESEHEGWSVKDKTVYEAVDLGLPSGLLWAAYNVGATSPEEYGGYYAWGEIYTKEGYNEGNCSTYGVELGDISGNPAYDAAAANWGGSWRMPTDIEFQELIDNCTWNWTTINGVSGYEVVGPNGNNIFLPAAGYRFGTSLRSDGSYGDYWSSSPRGTGTAYYLYFGSGRHRTNWDYRYYGRSIRPVTE